MHDQQFTKPGWMTDRWVVTGAGDQLNQISWRKNAQVKILVSLSVPTFKLFWTCTVMAVRKSWYSNNKLLYLHHVFALVIVHLRCKTKLFSPNILIAFSFCIHRRPVITDRFVTSHCMAFRCLNWLQTKWWATKGGLLEIIQAMPRKGWEWLLGWPLCINVIGLDDVHTFHLVEQGDGVDLRSSVIVIDADCVSTVRQQRREFS